MKIKKDQLIQAIKAFKGNVTDIASSLGISRQTFYNYADQDNEIHDLWMDQRQVIIDLAESKLLKLIDQENPQVIMFALKTLGKDRGYIEKQEVDQTNKTVNIIEVPKLDAYEPNIDEITDTEIN
jgi:AcrR family transcriptional regulator